MMKTLIEIHNLTSSFKSGRRSAEERMRSLGIEDSEYQKYEAMFLRPRERHHYLIHAQESWLERRHSWNRNLVLRHLTGEQTIGLFPADWIDYLMIDIDRHGNESEGNLGSRIREVTRAIDGDPLIYQSSFSGGVRLCYFFENGVPKEQLYRGYRRIFLENGIPMQSGVIEILATRKGDRLPFGTGSYLVDPFNLEPIYHLTLKDTISVAYNIFIYQKIELPFEVQPLDESIIFRSQYGSVFDLIAGQLHEVGLYPGITTNDALLKLNWDLQIRKGYSRSETEKFLIYWITTKHNNLSNRFNAGRTDQIRDQIHRIVVKTDPSKAKYSGSKYALRTKRLSLSDIRKIVTLTRDQKLQLAIFSLLEYCLCFGKKAQNRNEDEPLISNLYVSGKGDVTYRSGSQTNFYCEISQKTLQHLSGFDKANPQTTMAKVEALGLLSLKRRAHPESHHCRQYWVHFEFNEDDPEKVILLDEGSARLKQSERSCRDIENRRIEGGVIKK